MNPFEQEESDLLGAPEVAVSGLLHVGRPNVGDRETFLRHVEAMLNRGWLTNNGPLVQELEHRLADYLGVRHCIAVCNGTIALEIAIRALSMSGEVIIPSYTFVATAHAVQWQNLTPVFADIDPLTHCLDPASVRRQITPKTSGIVGVHLWGRTGAARELETIAAEFGLQLIFDAAHAFGCSADQTKVGSLGRAEVFSFHATKVFNTFEGGAVATNDDDLADTVRLMRNFGFAGLDRVIYPGTNGKMPEVCAAMGLTNLERIDEFIAANQRNYLDYCQALKGIPGISILRYDPSERNNFQYIVIEVGPESAATRDEIVNALHAKQVLARRYFWPGCHRMEPYRTLYPNSYVHLPVTEAVAARVVVLPTGMSIARPEIEMISAEIRRLAEAG